MTDDQLSEFIIGVAIQLHKNVGPGLLESVYEAALAYDLKEEGLRVKTQVPIPFYYKKVHQEIGFRIDLLVENRILIEVKSVTALADVHVAQTLTYLKLSGIKLGLLMNFNTKLLHHGIRRFVHKFEQ